jgi:hypothetical protein
MMIFVDQSHNAAGGTLYFPLTIFSIVVMAFAIQNFSACYPLSDILVTIGAINIAGVCIIRLVTLPTADSLAVPAAGFLLFVQWVLGAAATVFSFDTPDECPDYLVLLAKIEGLYLIVVIGLGFLVFLTFMASSVCHPPLAEQHPLIYV